MPIDLDAIANLARYGGTVPELMNDAPTVPADDGEGV